MLALNEYANVDLELAQDMSRYIMLIQLASLCMLSHGRLINQYKSVS